MVGIVIAVVVSCRTYTKDFINWNDTEIFDGASSDGVCSNTLFHREHVTEAKRRGLTCNAELGLRKEKAYQK